MSNQTTFIQPGTDDGAFDSLVIGSSNPLGEPMSIQTVHSPAFPVEVDSLATAVVAPPKGKKAPKQVTVEEAEVEEAAEPLQMPKAKVASYLSGKIEEFNHSQLVLIDDSEHPLFNVRDQKLGVSEDLLESLRAGGQIEPGIVYPDGNGKYIILSGNRRARNLKELGVKFKAQQAKPEVGDLGAVFIQIATNEVRVNDSIQVRGQNMQRVFNLNGGDVAAIAVMFGVTKQTVRDELALMEKATKGVVKAISDGIIGKTTGVRLAKLDPKEQDKAVEKARNLSAKLGDAHVAAKGKSLGKGKRGASKGHKVTEAQLLSQKPTTNLLREVAMEKSCPKDVTNILLWVVGDLDSEGAIDSLPWLKKFWNTLEHAPFDIE